MATYKEKKFGKDTTGEDKKTTSLLDLDNAEFINLVNKIHKCQLYTQSKYAKIEYDD